MLGVAIGNVTINDIGEPSAPEATPDDQIVAESAQGELADAKVNALEDDVKSLQVKNRLYNDSIKIDNDLRCQYVPKLYWLVVLWLVFVGLFVIVASSPTGSFTIFGLYIVVDINASDNLMITMLATTTATVFGLFMVVAKWMFPTRKGKDG